MAITVNNKFPVGSFVYLKTDSAARIRQITALELYLDGSYLYKLICGVESSYHFEIELMKEPKLDFSFTAE